jgi:hypothetical protein
MVPSNTWSSFRCTPRPAVFRARTLLPPAGRWIGSIASEPIMGMREHSGSRHEHRIFYAAARTRAASLFFLHEYEVYKTYKHAPDYYEA